MLFSTYTTDFLKWLSVQKYTQLVVLVDENTFLYCYPLLKNELPTHFLVKIPAGENHKNLQTCTQIWEQYTQFSLDRKALILHLGGGVLGDMGGFCASIYKRGVRFVQIPTTLLSQVDASVGGKLGIDFQNLKNHLGVFQNPENVWINPIFLDTLSKREKKSGFAEMLKHGIILSKNHWENLTESGDVLSGAVLENEQKNWENQDWQNVIRQSVLLKDDVVKRDFKEENIRKLLNFGHTIGHSVESYALTENISLLHGEAVAIGMHIETWLAYKKGILGENDFLEISNYLEKTYFIDDFFKSFLEKIKILENEKNLKDNQENDFKNTLFEAIFAFTLQDKKNQNHKILASLPTEIGKGIFDVEISKSDFFEGLSYFFGKF